MTLVEENLPSGDKISVQLDREDGLVRIRTGNVMNPRRVELIRVPLTDFAEFTRMMQKANGQLP
jgi:hypothetical protein